MTTDKIVGPFVLAAVEQNAQGFDVFRFSDNPYVHRSANGAEQEARRMAKLKEQPFAVFAKLYTVAVEVTATETTKVNSDKLAEALVDQLFERCKFSIPIEEARKIVHNSLKLSSD